MSKQALGQELQQKTEMYQHFRINLENNDDGVQSNKYGTVGIICNTSSSTEWYTYMQLFSWILFCSSSGSFLWMKMGGVWVQPSSGKEISPQDCPASGDDWSSLIATDFERLADWWRKNKQWTIRSKLCNVVESTVLTSGLHLIFVFYFTTKPRNVAVHKTAVYPRLDINQYS